MVDIKPLQWTSIPGKTKYQIMEDHILPEAIDHKDMGDHIWVAKLNNRGTSLFCYATARGDDGHWQVKQIPEDIGPDVYDCPIRLLEACVSRNPQWRQKVVEFHREQARKKAGSKE